MTAIVSIATFSFKNERVSSKWCTKRVCKAVNLQEWVVQSEHSRSSHQMSLKVLHWLTEVGYENYIVTKWLVEMAGCRVNVCVRAPKLDTLIAFSRLDIPPRKGQRMSIILKALIRAWSYDTKPVMSNASCFSPINFWSNKVISQTGVMTVRHYLGLDAIVSPTYQLLRHVPVKFLSLPSAR